MKKVLRLIRNFNNFKNTFGKKSYAFHSEELSVLKKPSSGMTRVEVWMSDCNISPDENSFPAEQRRSIASCTLSSSPFFDNSVHWIELDSSGNSGPKDAKYCNFGTKEQCLSLDDYYDFGSVFSTNVHLDNNSNNCLDDSFEMQMPSIERNKWKGSVINSDQKSLRKSSSEDGGDNKRRKNGNNRDRTNDESKEANTDDLRAKRSARSKRINSNRERSTKRSPCPSRSLKESSPEGSPKKNTNNEIDRNGSRKKPSGSAKVSRRIKYGSKEPETAEERVAIIEFQ